MMKKTCSSATAAAHCEVRSRSCATRLLILYLVILVCQHSASAADLEQRAVPDASTDILRVFYAPFDAPFIRSEYNLRINSLLASLDPLGRRSFLIDSPVEAYKARLSRSAIPDYSLAPRGKGLLDENRSWLLDKTGKPTSGYLEYSATHAKIAKSLQAGELAEAKKDMLHFFLEGQAFRYISAEQIVIGLSPNPIHRIFRTITDRGSVSVSDNSYVLFPRPDDLDIAENWRPILLKSTNRMDAITGMGIYIEVFVVGADRVLESLVEVQKGEPFYLPRRLLFVKSLQYSPATDAARGEITTLDIPEENFNVYRNSSTGSSIIFLLMVEMEKCAM